VLALWFTVPGLRHTAPSRDQIAMTGPPPQMGEAPVDVAAVGATDVGLLRNYGVVTKLDLLENYDVIEHLDELRPALKTRDAVRS
jgi:hypothetical protein